MEMDIIESAAEWMSNNKKLLNAIYALGSRNCFVLIEKNDINDGKNMKAIDFEIVDNDSDLNKLGIMELKMSLIKLRNHKKDNPENQIIIIYDNKLYIPLVFPSLKK